MWVGCLETGGKKMVEGGEDAEAKDGELGLSVAKFGW